MPTKSKGQQTPESIVVPVATEEKPVSPENKAPEADRQMVPSVKDLRQMVVEQELAEIRACWSEIEQILAKHNSHLVPAISFFGKRMKADVVIEKNEPSP